MTAKQFEKMLDELDACSDARKWSKGKTLKKAWSTCVRADWMCWLLIKQTGKLGWPNKRVVRHILCDCAETALKYTTDPRPAEAIRIARLYADGKATDEQLAAASAAASDAAWAASAAAWAARDAARDAASAAAWDAALKEMSDLIRKRIKL